MSYRNSERKTQEMMHATIAVAVARAMLFLRPRRFFCDTEEDEEDVKGSIFDIFSLSVFCARATTTTLLSLSLKEARFSLEFRMDFFQFISRHYIHTLERARARERVHTHTERESVSEDTKKKTKKSRQNRAQRHTMMRTFLNAHRGNTITKIITAFGVKGEEGPLAQRRRRRRRLCTCRGPANEERSGIERRGCATTTLMTRRRRRRSTRRRGGIRSTNNFDPSKEETKRVLLTEEEEDDHHHPSSTGDDPKIALLSVQQFLIENIVSSPLFYVTFGVAGGVYLVQKFGSNASLVFSAAPIVALTYISKSEFGRTLEEAAKKAKEMDERGEDGGREGREKRRGLAKRKFPKYFGEERGRWLPRAFASPESPLFPSYLDGTLAGDAQFDPLRLSNTKEKMRRNVELELLHGRWAMLAVVGVCVPEVLSRSGALELSEPIWWKVGEKVLEGIDVNYLGIEGFHIAGASGIIGIAFCQAVLMGGPEYARYVGIESLEPVGVYLPGDLNYPGGGPFDPFNLSADAERDVEWRVAEVKHGRLAMIAMLGVFAQAFVTREGPIANVLEFF